MDRTASCSLLCDVQFGNQRVLDRRVDSFSCVVALSFTVNLNGMGSVLGFAVVPVGCCVALL